MMVAAARLRWTVLGLAAFPAMAATPALTATNYRQALAPVGDCTTFARALPTLPDARALLRDLFDGGLPTQARGEADARFVERMVTQLFDRLGDPSRLHLRIRLSEAARYDPARGALAVRLPHPFEAELDRWGGTERQVGGTRLLTEAALRTELDFAPDAAPDLLLAMSPVEAARFTTEGRLDVLAVFEDMGTDAAHRPAPGPGAAAVQTSYKLVRLRPRCALVTNGGQPVAGWRYDRWAEAPGD